jgi:hypothetical protein
MLLERMAAIRPPLSGLQFSALGVVPLSDPAAAHQLSFDALKPLMLFSNLKNIEIHHNAPLALTDMNIEELASKIPWVETCVLNHKPTKVSLDIDMTAMTTPTLASILSFARHCPNIHLLALYLDARSPPVHTEHLPRFHQLRCLSVGKSPIASAQPIARFFSRVLPTGCTIDSNCHRVAHFDVWEKVKDVLPSLVSMRVEEEERTRLMLKRVSALEAEVESLRAHRD